VALWMGLEDGYRGIGGGKLRRRQRGLHQTA
jgi:hypothetical protein